MSRPYKDLRVDDLLSVAGPDASIEVLKAISVELAGRKTSAAKSLKKSIDLRVENLMGDQEESDPDGSREKSESGSNDSPREARRDTPEIKGVRAKLTQLFKFLLELNNLRYPAIIDIDEQEDVLWLDDLPEHPSVAFSRNSDDQQAEGKETPLLVVSKPKLDPCPEPPALIKDWLKPGWSKPSQEPEFHKRLRYENKEASETLENDSKRAAAKENWLTERGVWAVAQKPALKAESFYQRLFEWYGIRQRDEEKTEFILGDGFFQCDSPDKKFRHPILLHKVELEFHPEGKPPYFLMLERDQPAELYSELLRLVPDANLPQIAECAEEVDKLGVTPARLDQLEGFLRRVIQGVLPRGGEFHEVCQVEAPSDHRASIALRPCLLIRERRPGLASFFARIIEDIQNRNEFSPALLSLLAIHEKKDSEVSPEENGSFANEDPDILLSKPANREQLEIAKQLQRKSGVIVQGPPGTGKSHTIANLIGHLLSEGKRILVTAHSPKALRVLRDKIVEPLRPLCLNVLTSERESHEELKASIQTINARLSESAEILEREAKSIRETRLTTINQLKSERERLYLARMDECRDVTFAGVSVSPGQAAKRVKIREEIDSWIPSPVKLGDPLPLRVEEIVSLYHTNGSVSFADERSLAAPLPDLAALPTPTVFNELSERYSTIRSTDINFRGDLWTVDPNPDDLAGFSKVQKACEKAILFLRTCENWEAEAMEAGFDGGVPHEIWESFAKLIDSSWERINQCELLVLQHGPEAEGVESTQKIVETLLEIKAHAANGNSFGVVTKFTRREWHRIADATKISGLPMNLASAAHVEAALALHERTVQRKELVSRWKRQMEGRCSVSAERLGAAPEKLCRQYSVRIREGLEWHDSVWKPLEAELAAIGLNFPKLVSTLAADVGDGSLLRRVQHAVANDLGSVLASRAALLEKLSLERQLAKWLKVVDGSSNAAYALFRAIEKIDAPIYAKAYEELVRLSTIIPDLKSRKELLNRLDGAAPAWASAIKNRVGKHGETKPPGDPASAWEWRQLFDELENRAAVSLTEIQGKIESLSTNLLKLTAQLVEKQTWAKQIRQTDGPQRQALGEYALYKKKITKGGSGKRDEEFRKAARRAMTRAKDAVPVWIMPLADVAETFDPRTSRFDVVIIDEASQCDPTELHAFYLGKKVVVVGDDEQVTPLAVGNDLTEVSALIHSMLSDIPGKEAYDGETSIYEFAQTSFGGNIRLTEHFRCAPSIISFSNALSYKGEIKPLRDSSAVPIAPHVIRYRVPNSVPNNEAVNIPEALHVASLVIAASRDKNYGGNGTGKKMSFGVVSLSGPMQAQVIDEILRNELEEGEYAARAIQCGDSSSFQGDERDVIFISLVDGPAESPPHALRAEGQKNMYKKRFNVAASRARNQMWVIDSMNHEVDLKAGDIRRRLIEHAIDPGSWERELKKKLGEIDQNSKEFEGKVLQRLMEKKYVVHPQYPLGNYFIDLVVEGAGKKLAVECDGDTYHGPEQLRADIERQAVLERLGMTFVRIRYSLFGRDPDRAMKEVFNRLNEMGIPPEMELKVALENPQNVSLTDHVITSAAQIRATWEKEGMPIPQVTRRRRWGAS
jgi:very-short-patch-repair endonuclease